ncbi:hypothetical protein RhiirC2_435690 [Rhizophagus irregularis]|uniref:Uncharacterized protein n=1 Tax=Rhizophagus irregularis TaxID=588596 RepID=A0A2N1NBF0_9GLOM|nr:hypothetical protein RhiirC2_435690 [Rhizophagus irregularis]
MKRFTTFRLSFFFFFLGDRILDVWAPFPQFCFVAIRIHVSTIASRYIFIKCILDFQQYPTPVCAQPLVATPFGRCLAA